VVARTNGPAAVAAGLGFTQVVVVVVAAELDFIQVMSEEGYFRERKAGAGAAVEGDKGEAAGAGAAAPGGDLAEEEADLLQVASRFPSPF
jgi:hypothetical protein